jgi:acyl dehydratase
VRYFEDFRTGDEYRLATVTVDYDEMVAFARRFDPQPFHVDDELAKESSFGELIASGWFTGSLFMRMFVDELLSDAASHGSPGVEELRWLRPVRAGDQLTGRVTVLDVWPSSKRDDRGTVLCRSELVNQDGEVVMSLRSRGLFGRDTNGRVSDGRDTDGRDPAGRESRDG